MDKALIFYTYPLEMQEIRKTNQKKMIYIEDFRYVDHFSVSSHLLIYQIFLHEIYHIYRIILSECTDVLRLTLEK